MEGLIKNALLFAIHTVTEAMVQHITEICTSANIGNKKV
jgi:hypothetical protein